MIKAFIIILLAATSSAFYSGVNLYCNLCAHDYGEGYFRPEHFDELFRNFSNAGVQVVRVNIHDHAQNRIGQDGSFLPINDSFLNDFRLMLKIAQQNNLKVFLSLFTGDRVLIEPFWILIKDENKINSYIFNGLLPLLYLIKLENFDKTIFAIEVVNQPEYIYQIQQWPPTEEEIKIMQSFLTKCNNIIREKGFEVTVSSASLKYSCNCGTNCIRNLWGNTGITFYSLAYYDPTYLQEPIIYDPFSTKPSDWCLDKPALITDVAVSSFNTKSGVIDVKTQYYLLHQNGWAGFLSFDDHYYWGPAWGEIQEGLKCQKDWDACKPKSVWLSHQK